MHRALALLPALLALGLILAAAPAGATGAVVCYPWPFGGGGGCAGAEPFSFLVFGCVGTFQEIYYGLWAGAAVCV